MLEHEWDETKRASLWDILARIRAALTEIETAKVLTVPPELLARADKVIE
jgi:hypothetical protein